MFLVPVDWQMVGVMSQIDKDYQIISALNSELALAGHIVLNGPHKSGFLL